MKDLLAFTITLLAATMLPAQTNPPTSPPPAVPSTQGVPVSPTVSVIASHHLAVARERVLARGGISQPENRQLTPAAGFGRTLKMTISKTGAASLRFHFKVVALPQAAGDSSSVMSFPRDWILLVTATASDLPFTWSHSGNDSPELRALDPTAGQADFWSDEIPGNRASIEIINGDPRTIPKLELVQTVMTGPVAYPQSIWGTNDIWDITSTHKDITEWPRIQTVGKSVARIRFVTDDGIAAYCTGFMVSKDLLLTNDHCIRSDAEMKSALLDFNYTNPSVTLRPIRLSKLVAHDAGLDFSLVRLQNPPDLRPLPLTTVAPTDKQQLCIIQHPGGDVKSVSIKDCAVWGATVIGTQPDVKSDFGHRCDTLGGSSGSPVLVLVPAIRVAGLHHLGFYEDDPNPVNQAVRIQEVLDAIARQAAAVRQEIADAQQNIPDF